ncbi:PREDICTED: protein FAM53B [Elephantulus edwardii]|uniref:protein FAM53B n=1 Tax=Elephantulus edwardii TaxID=28737 RepID=UPI0003F0EA67|nr:PREDICTED: protein FAM53B [Elephantulus edwardii]
METEGLTQAAHEVDKAFLEETSCATCGLKMSHARTSECRWTLTPEKSSQDLVCPVSEYSSSHSRCVHVAVRPVGVWDLGFHKPSFRNLLMADVPGEHVFPRRAPGGIYSSPGACASAAAIDLDPSVLRLPNLRDPEQKGQRMVPRKVPGRDRCPRLHTPRWLVPALGWSPVLEVPTMVMVLSKSLSDQGTESRVCRPFSPELCTAEKMSQGPTLFSCGVMENDHWRDLDRKCPLQIDQPRASLWECLPERCPEGSLWHREAVTACAVTSLIKDLSISDRNGHPSAPPSKRQCRSLSFSDEMSSCRTSWRPLGSKVWTPVEKRRCFSGGSVQRYASGLSTVQRSSSFSLPSRASALPSARDHSTCDQAGLPLHPREQEQPGQGSLGPATCGQAGGLWSPDPSPLGGGRLDVQRSLSCSHEQFSFSGYCPPSASSTPASTPELTRRSSGLSRSRSQPCVLNDKKVGVKRRRPEDTQDQRPSLDLAKMAQNCQTFSSLSCPNAGLEDCGPPSPFAIHSGTCCRTTLLSASSTSTGGRTPAGTPVLEPLPHAFDDHLASKEDLSCEEVDSCALDEYRSHREEPASTWRDLGAMGSGLCSLDGELDIEQIENN